MHGPPPTPQELCAKLHRYVREPRFAEVPFRDAVFRAADDFEVSPYEIFDILGDTDF